MSRVKPITELSSENEHNLNTVKRLRQELKEVTEDRDKYENIYIETAALLVNNKTNIYFPEELLYFWDKIRAKYSK